MARTRIRRSRRQQFLAILTAGFLLSGAAAAVADGDNAPNPAPAEGSPSESGALGLSLGGLLGKALGATELLAPSGLGRLKVPGDVRVLVISSGADKATFGDGYDKTLTRSGDIDAVGLGTYATSVLFQVAPKAHVTAVDVYRKGKVDRAAVGEALHWAVEHPTELDAVVMAFPPASLLDPMAAGLAEARSESPAGDAERITAGLAQGWAKVREDAAALAAAGVAVVAPAGDLGPGPQSVLGVAGLPEVITVGAADRDGVAAASAGGPSVFGRVKPDLVAPAGIAGLVPDGSSLAGLLDLGGPGGPSPTLDLPVPAAGGRAALVGSTIPAAAAVAAITAQLHHDGVGDAATLRGILTASAVPVTGVPVWRQGAGRLAEAPRADLARQRPLVAGSADLGPEPAAGRPWAADLKLLNGTAGAGPAFDLAERITTTASAKREATNAGAGEPRPVPSLGAVADGLSLTLPPGDNPWAPGAWCGYLHLPLTGLGVSIVEDVPLCLVEGLSLTAFNFYIHDMPAEDLTFALIPALPPGLGLLDGPLMVLPLNPLQEPLLAGVSGPDGLVHFGNVPPAYFVMRQFSDYSAPVAEDLPAAGGGEPTRKARDLGEPSYLNYDALVLPNPCPERIQDHWPTGTPCHQAWLEQRFGSGSVRYDRTTARYFVATPAGEMGIVFDFTKKSPGTGVTSRYVDLLTHDDLQHGSAARLPSDGLEGLQPTLDALGLHLSPAWSFQSAGAAGDPEGTVATYKGLDAQHQPTSLVGASTYPFALTTPNYRGTMALNFGYMIDDALVLVVATVGTEVRTAVLTPQGNFEVDKVNLHDVLKQVPPFGVGTGQASFTFDLKPHGNAEGTLSFLVLPLNPLRPASVHLKDRSFELTTWQRIDWPPAMMPRGAAEVMGHSFQVDPHYSARQMNHPACRRIDNGRSAADICEGWQVMVHSPLDDAETFDVVDPADGLSFLAALARAGGELVNPHRGTQGQQQPLLDTGGLPLPILTRALVSAKLGVVVNGRFWEQLVLPTAALAAHPGLFEVRIEDNAKGRDSTLLPHRDGAVTLAPYIGFNPWHRRADTGLLREAPVPAAPPAPKSVPALL